MKSELAVTQANDILGKEVFIEVLGSLDRMTNNLERFAFLLHRGLNPELARDVLVELEYQGQSLFTKRKLQ